MVSSDIEPFPTLDGPALHTQNGRKITSRRKLSGGLGAELPGDSDVAALGTLSADSPPATPTDNSVQIPFSLYQSTHLISPALLI